MKRKTIQITLQITSGLSDFDNALAIESILNNSPLNNAEYALSIDETKVVEKREITIEHHESSLS